VARLGEASTSGKASTVLSIVALLSSWLLFCLPLCGQIFYEPAYEEQMGISVYHHRGFGEDAFYWSATEKNKIKAYYRHFWGRASIYKCHSLKDNGYTVRCIKDE
jgi:hypothetical protein